MKVLSSAAQPVMGFYYDNGVAKPIIEYEFVTQDLTHKRIHEGVMFQNSYKSPNASPVVDDGFIDTLIKTGNNITHLVYECNAGGDVEILFYEDVVVSDNGTELNTNNNLNRLKTNVSSTLAFVNPAITSTGLTLQNTFLGGGTGGNASGVNQPFSWREWNLKPNAFYLVRCINRAGQSKPISITIQWYETTP